MGVLKRYRDFEYVQIDDDSILSVPGLDISQPQKDIPWAQGNLPDDKGV